MKAKAGAFVMAGLLAVYLVLVCGRAVAFLMSGELVGQVLGVALLVFPLIGAWALVREMLFGFQSDRLLRTMGDEGEVPEWVQGSQGGRRTRTPVTEPRLLSCAENVEHNSTNWRAWFLLGLAHDGCGDRRRARAAIRRATVLSRAK